MNFKLLTYIIVMSALEKIYKKGLNVTAVQFPSSFINQHYDTVTSEPETDMT